MKEADAAFFDRMWDYFLKQQDYDFWMTMDRPITAEEIEKYPLAKQAAKVKNSKLYKALK